MDGCGRLRVADRLSEADERARGNDRCRRLQTEETIMRELVELTIEELRLVSGGFLNFTGGNGGLGGISTGGNGGHQGTQCLLYYRLVSK